MRGEAEGSNGKSERQAMQSQSQRSYAKCPNAGNRNQGSGKCKRQCKCSKKKYIILVVIMPYLHIPSLMGERDESTKEM